MSDVSVDKLADAASFLSFEIRAALAADPDGASCGNLRQRHVALLSIDIVGFSGHTKALLEARTDGAEALHRELQSHYLGVVTAIRNAGGEPIAFIGDALLAVWDMAEAGSGIAVRQAARLAFDLAQSRLEGAGQFDLNLHLSCGTLQTVQLGGITRRWLSTTLGSALTALREIASIKAPNSVILTAEVAQVCGPLCKAIDHAPGNQDHPFPAAQLAHYLIEAPEVQVVASAEPAPLPIAAWSAILARTPRYVGRWIERVGLEWIAELRPLTVVTVALRQFDASSEDAADHLDAIVRATQEIVQGRDGTVDSVVVDEKGASVLVFFGTPPNAHADDPRRSVMSAMELRKRLDDMGVAVTVGIATGRAFCGVIGTPAFRSFLVIGDVINLSSRLAWAAGQGILVDQQTYQATLETGVFENTPTEWVLKGIGGGTVGWAIAPETSPRAGTVITAGRTAEVNMLRRLWAETAAGEDSLGVIIQGESGTGKTNLALDLRDHIEANNGAFRMGTAAVTDQETPYSALRRIITFELGILPGMTLIERRSAISANLPKALLDQAPLLDAVFPSGLSETVTTEELSGGARSLAIETLLVTLLHEVFASRPSCLCIDDAQWLDPASVHLITRLRMELPGLLMVILSQPMADTGWLDDLAAAGMEKVILQPLTRAGLEDLVMRKLGVKSADTRLLDQLEQTAAGHPFFSAEILANLNANGHIMVVEGRAHLASIALETPLGLPTSLHGMVLQRLDHPEPEEQLSLRVASVAGLLFPTKIVADIHPMHGSRGNVHKHMLALSKLNILEPRVAGDRPGYGFRLGIFRDVAYTQLPHLERTALHAKAAQWIDVNSGADRVNALQELANHWDKAGEPERAVDCLLEEALRLFRQGFAVESVRAGLRAIRISGVPTSEDAAVRGAEIGAGLAALQSGADGWNPEKLLGKLRPPSPDLALQLRALLMTAPFAFQSNQVEIFAWAATTAMRLVIDNESGPPPAFSMFSIVIAGLTGDRKTAAAWSRAALDLDAAMGGSFLPAVGFIDTWFHGHWRDHLMANVDLNQRAAMRALTDGDVQYASYNIAGSVVQRAAAGQSLNTILAASAETDQYSLLRNTRVQVLLEQQLARALRGETVGPLSLTSHGIVEETDIAWVIKSDYVNQIGYYLATRLRLLAYMGERQAVLETAAALVPLAPAIAGQTAEFDSAFHSLIARIWLVIARERDSKAEETAIAQGLAQFRSWAEISPQNFAFKAAILTAMEAGITGDRSAMARALVASLPEGDADYGLSDRAVALECAAFLAPDGGYTLMAIAAYEAWGATAVAKRLKDQVQGTVVSMSFV